MLRTSAGLILLFLSARPARPAEIEIRFSALEKIVAQQAFTEDGRHYVKGSQAAKCKYAYLEAPKLGASGGMLRIAAKFSGKTALDMFGRCVGVGDSFDVTVLSNPVPRAGGIAFQDTVVSTPKDSFYIRRVREAMRQAFNKDVIIDVRSPAKTMLEQNHEGAPYQQEMKDFDFTGIRVTNDALVLVVDFKVIVK